MSTKKKQLFEITMTAFKTFFVEAESQAEALESVIVEDESSSMCGDVDWEHEETRAVAVGPQRSEQIRAQRPKEILT